MAPPPHRNDKKTGPEGPAGCLVAGGGSHCGAGKADSAPTWRAVALVVAPQEHPLPVGLRSKREAGHGARQSWKHATPLTEALHVPLHLVRWYRRAASAPPYADAGRRALGLAGRQGDACRGGACRLRPAVRDETARLAGTSARELLTAAPSMSASLPAIVQCVSSRTSSFQTRPAPSNECACNVSYGWSLVSLSASCAAVSSTGLALGVRLC
jgi:hypothetical protein